MKFSALLFVLLALVSCQDIEVMEKPKNLISEEKMVDVLTELSILYGTRTFDRSRLEKSGLLLDQYIYGKYDIDSVQFRKANAYYSENPAIYVRIYDSVKTRLETLKVKYEALKLEQERIADSIRNIEEDTLITPGESNPKDSLQFVTNKKIILPEDSTATNQ